MTSLAPVADPVPGSPADHPPPPRTVGSRHVGRWIWAAVVLVLVVWALRSVALNPAFGWGTVADYLFTTAVLRGLDRKSTRLNSSHSGESRMPSSA